MRLREYFDQIRRSSPGTLVALAAVVVVWILVLAMIIAGIVFYFERPNLAQPPAPGAATAPAIAAEPTAGPAGTPVTITGQGWAAGSIISIYLLAPGQAQLPNFATAQATADAQGLFTTTVAIPLEGDWLAPGTAQVMAEVAGGGASARTIFVVLPTTPNAQPPIGTETPTPVPTPSAQPPSGTETPIPTPTPGPPTATANTAVNVRLGPGTDYPMLGTLLAGQSAGITGVSADGAWWQISFAGGPGWVSAFFVTAQNTQNVPVVVPPSLPPTPTPVPQAPLAVISVSNQGPTGQVVTFDGSGSRASPGHNLVAFAWDFGDGTTANGVIVGHSYAQPGNYVVTLTVTDDQGLTAEATQTIQFQRLPPIPIIGGPNRGTVGDSISFDGSQSIANTGVIVSYAWDFGDGTSSNGITVNHVYDQPGRYRVILTTTNSAGLSASADHDIRIEGQPTAIINAPSQGQVGQPITFYGSSSNTNGNDVVSFAWNFGDGAYANGQTVSHVYAQPGSFVVTLTVTNNRGLSDTATQTIYISQVSQPPTAVIRAPNQGTAGQSITFDGTGSNPGSGQIVSFAWTFGDGTAANGPVVTHVYAQPGTYTVSLNVTNSSNLSAQATQTIYINQAAQPPTAVIKAPGQGTAGQSITFDGTGSNPGSGQIVSFAWNFGDGTNANGPVVSHVYAQAGNYIVALNVTNNSNLSGQTTQSITINRAAQPPMAVINAPGQGAEGQPVSFDGTQSVAGSGQIVKYDWNFGDGATGSGATVSHVYAKAGNYTVTLNVTNSSNLSAQATHAITINQAAQPPTAVINAPNQGTEGRPFSFDGSGSTPGSGQIVSFAWNFGDGATGSGATVSHIYAKPGNYTVSLKVTNSGNQTATAELTIYINPPAQPPTAVINARGQGTEGQPVSFDGSSSTPGSGQIVKYDWSFGDGATGSGRQVTHTYAQAGSFTVMLTVTNSDNRTASATHAIQVGGGEQKPPRAVINAPNQGQVGRSIAFDGSRSTAGGQITGYAWDFGDGATGNGATASHAYANAGSYTVSLTVTSSTGQTASATHTIRIEGGQPGGENPPGGINPPGGGIEQPGGGNPLFGGGNLPFGGGQGGLRAVISAPATGRVNQPIAFDGSRSSAGGSQIASYAWNFGDGATGSGPTVSHAYAKAGLYLVTLTVTDSRGQTASATRGVVIP
jgi:PKD repeat protein